MRTATLIALLALACCLVPEEAASQGRGVQRTPDGKRVLVSKDVGRERWAIALNPEGFGPRSAIGNVFFPDGGDPAFIYCIPAPAEGNTFTCYGASACADGRCSSQFGVIGFVTLPDDFFAVPGEVAITLRTAALAAGEAGATDANGEAQVEPDRGLQLTPDLQYVMVNKDVGPERWAITLDRDDGTATGNVFRPDGGDPAFIWCEPTGVGDQLRCFGADACTAPPCAESFALVGTVELPPTFFGVRTATCGNGREEPGERCDPPGRSCEVVCGVDLFCIIQVGVAPVPLLGTCATDCSACLP